MILQLAVSTFMVLLTVVIHGGGLAILGRMLRGEVQVERAHHVPGFSLRTMGFTLALVLALFVLHGFGIWLYAFLYLYKAYSSGLVIILISLKVF